MKKFILAALLLASSAAFAQSNPAPEPSPREKALAIGRTMGMLPVMQDACGHTKAQKAEFKVSLGHMVTKLSQEEGPDFKSAYEAGVKQGEALMGSQTSNIEPERLEELCKKFNDAYPELMEKLNAAKQRTEN